MFLGREEELARLRSEFASESKSAILIYGKRRVGKSTLIAHASKEYTGTVIPHICIKSSYAGNLELLCRSVSQALNIPVIKFNTIFDLFDYLASLNRRLLIIIDEYQYFKASLPGDELDSYMQIIIDRLPDNIDIILCGSYITVMKELLSEDNPLFGRFTTIIHLNEMDYYDAARFCPGLSVRDKIAFYAVFGGSPYVLSHLDYTASFDANIRNLLIDSNSLLRTHIESVMLGEIKKNYDVRILEYMGNGKRKYSEIESAISSGADNGLLDKQLKLLLGMEVIEKVYPINKRSDRKKSFYEIRDNLLRFYFAYIFGRDGSIPMIGAQNFYDSYIRASVNEFISLRFEGIVKQYFIRMAHSGLMPGIEDIGSYWYDNVPNRRNGQFDCCIRRSDGIDIFEVKYHAAPLSRSICEHEASQFFSIPGLTCRSVGFVCSSGFDFTEDKYILITGEDLYKYF